VLVMQLLLRLQPLHLLLSPPLLLSLMVMHRLPRLALHHRSSHHHRRRLHMVVATAAARLPRWWLPQQQRQPL